MSFNVISVPCKRLPEDVKFQKSKSIDGCLKYLFRKNIGKNNTGIFMFVMHHSAV